MEQNESQEIKQTYEADREQIVAFFLNVYISQLKVPKSAEAKVRMVPEESDDPDYTYELKVKRGEKPETRRMTVSMLSDGGGSKSRCYKVVYDDQLVIKIPPVPITTFDEYVECISAERRIAVKLSPILEFVAPGVTAMLKRIKPISDTGNMSAMDLEKGYIKWLKNHPKFQRYLKIGDTFVFIMDLSRHFFLSGVVAQLHVRGFKDMLQEEVMQSHDLIWDLTGFEGKYGVEHLSVCLDMHRVFTAYEKGIRTFLSKYGISTQVSPYEKQKWFLDHLAEKKVTLKTGDFSPEFKDDLDRFILDIISENKEDVDAYRKTLKSYIVNVTFSQNKAKMSGLVTNILLLLAWLSIKGLSIRDLKPDNLFVVGSTEKNPFLLGAAEAYSLGLIDFETAVVIRPAGKKPILQPLKAGTPSYATPSHLFSNEILEKQLGSPADILHIQDWHAVTGIIYNIVTGETLFEQTRKLFGKIKEMTRKAHKKKQTTTDVFKRFSRIFWSNAVREFGEKMASNDHLLQSVDAVIPEKAAEVMKGQAVRVQEKIERSIQKRVISQVIFSGDKNKNNLIRSSTEEICGYKEKWEKGTGTPKTSPEIREQIIRLLSDLEQLKKQSDEQKRIIEKFRNPAVKMSVYNLLHIFFDTVFKSMYDDSWGPLSVEWNPDETYDMASDETTILYESTIMYD